MTIKSFIGASVALVCVSSHSVMAQSDPARAKSNFKEALERVQQHPANTDRSKTSSQENISIEAQNNLTFIAPTPLVKRVNENGETVIEHMDLSEDEK